MRASSSGKIDSSIWRGGVDLEGKIGSSIWRGGGGGGGP